MKHKDLVTGELKSIEQTLEKNSYQAEKPKNEAKSIGSKGAVFK